MTRPRLLKALSRQLPSHDPDKGVFLNLPCQAANSISYASRQTATQPAQDTTLGQKDNDSLPRSAARLLEALAQYLRTVHVFAKIPISWEARVGIGLASLFLPLAVQRFLLAPSAYYPLPQKVQTTCDKPFFLTSLRVLPAWPVIFSAKSVFLIKCSGYQGQPFAYFSSDERQTITSGRCRWSRGSRDDE